MRCTQIMGFTKEAKDFINENVNMIPGVVCPKCGEVITTQLDCQPYEDAKGLGMFEDGPMLMKYVLKDGKIAFEKIQETVWSSGPCIFSCLEIDGALMFKWSEEEIRQA